MANKLEPYTKDVAVASAGTPVRLSDTPGLLARMVFIVGRKAAKTDNAGTIYLGTTEGDAAMSGGAFEKQPFHVPTSDLWQFPIPDGTCIDLYDIWVDADYDGDHAIVLYYQ